MVFRIHTSEEDKRSLYGAHNFIVVAGRETFGLFFDYPSAITFDIGYTKVDTLQVSCENADLNLFVIDGNSPYDIVKQFRFLSSPARKQGNPGNSPRSG